MPLTPGTRLGPYEIIAPIGAGGMGEVYKARDTRLERFAAIKVLPAARVGDAERTARFMQEARSASALNHPNIITVYEVNVDGDNIYIAMELVDGKPLDQLIPAGDMKLKAALEIVIQVTEALAKAHAAAIVHRDLKPGNIMVTAEGRVKLLDFGLAKFTEPAAEEGASHTITMATLTQEGSIVGTAAYMSPEQAEGKPVDGRSDIFSFGAVLYEMLSGQRAFQGNSIISTLAAVLEKDPPPSSAAAPREVERIVYRCLRKEPARRYQHAGDIRIALEDALADAGTPHTSMALPAVAPRRRRLRWSWLAIAAAVLLAWSAGWWFRPDAAPLPGLNLQRLTGDPGLTTNAAISPDGSLIAYASDRAGNGDLDIWVQHRGGGNPIRVTHDNSDEFDPAFSADGAQIVYVAGDGIYLVPALGGEPRRLTNAGQRPRLSPDGKRLVYQNRINYRGGSQLSLLEIGSGQPRPIAEKLPGPRFPVWSPDGKYLLVETFFPGHLGWSLVSMDELKTTDLGQSPGVPEQWLPGDRILFHSVGGGYSGIGDVSNLGMVAISPGRTRLAGSPRRLTDGTALIGGGSVANDGTVVLSAGSFRSNLWNLPFDADAGKVMGAVAPLTQDVAYTAYPSISLDGKRLVFNSDLDGNYKVWLMDMPSRHRRQLTPLTKPEYRPVLSPDGTRLAYSGGTSGPASTMSADILTMWADVTSFDQPGAPRIACPEQCGPMVWDWFSDNRGFLINTSDAQSGPGKDIGLVPPGSPMVEFAKASGRLFQAHPSPDGNWGVIGSNGMKIARLHDSRMPPENQWKSVEKGGDLYRWSPDGNTIFFTDQRDKFRCIWGRRLNPSTKEPVGEAFPVYHSHGAHLSMLGLPDSGAVGLAVARDKIVFAQAERAGNLWIGKLDLK